MAAFKDRWYKPSDFRIGITAWFVILIAISVAFFNLLNPASDSALWNIYSFGLLFGLAGAGVMDIELHFTIDANELRAVMLGIMGGAALVVWQIVASAFLMVAGFDMSSSGIVTLLAPASEELIFRVVIYTTVLIVMKGAPWFVPAITSETMFAAFHWFAYGHVNLMMFPIILVGGFILAYVYYKSRNAGASMLAHLINNGIGYIILIGTMMVTNIMVVGIIIALVILLYMCGGRKR